MLGDLTESIGVGAAERVDFETSQRLAPLFRAIAARERRLLVGNHDTRAIRMLETVFGRENVSNGGFEIGRISVRHGHEARPVWTWFEGKIGHVAVPLYERFRRGKPAERLDNGAVLREIRGSS